MAKWQIIQTVDGMIDRASWLRRTLPPLPGHRYPRGHIAERMRDALDTITERRAAPTRLLQAIPTTERSALYSTPPADADGQGRPGHGRS